MTSLLVADLDGTLAQRGRQVGVETLTGIRRLIHHGWDVAILTGRPISNLRSRLRSLKSVSLRAITCEGAAWWRYDAGAWSRDLSGAATPFSRETIATLRAWLRRSLADETASHGVRVLANIEVWEHSLLVFKIAAGAGERRALASRLESRLEAAAFGIPLRVGISGRTTLVIGRKDVDKARTLTQLATMSPYRQVVYLADEFSDAGNDSCTLGVRDVLKVNVGRPLDAPFESVVEIGGGPPGARRILSELARRHAPAMPGADVVGRSGNDWRERVAKWKRIV